MNFTQNKLAHRGILLRFSKFTRKCPIFGLVRDTFFVNFLSDRRSPVTGGQLPMKTRVNCFLRFYLRMSLKRIKIKKTIRQ